MSKKKRKKGFLRNLSLAGILGIGLLTQGCRSTERKLNYLDYYGENATNQNRVMISESLSFDLPLNLKIETGGDKILIRTDALSRYASILPNSKNSPELVLRVLREDYFGTNNVQWAKVVETELDFRKYSHQRTGGLLLPKSSLVPEKIYTERNDLINYRVELNVRNAGDTNLITVGEGKFDIHSRYGLPTYNSFWQ